MSSKQIGHRSGFECFECGKAIHPMAYRAACPDCGGRLRPVTGPD